MTVPDTPVITARDLTKNDKGRKVLTGLTFELAEGRLHGLLGRNGAGKTTLLRVVAGQLQHSGGVRVFGADPFDEPAVMDRTVLAGIDAPLPDG